MLYPLFLSNTPPITLDNDEEESSYIESSYWTKDETKAAWYKEAYFPYCSVNAIPPSAYTHDNLREAAINKINALYKLADETFSHQESLVALLKKEQPLVTNAIYNAESFDIRLYSIHQVLGLIQDKVKGQRRIIKKIQKRLDCLEKLREKREDTPFSTPDELRFCFVGGEFMRDFITAKNIAAVFAMGGAQFTALQAKLEKVKQNQRYGDWIVTIEDTTYYRIDAIAPYLIPSRMLNNEFYDVKKYGKDENAKSVCHYLFGPVIKQFKDTQTSQESVRTIAFSAFENKKIDRTAVIEAALNHELTIYLKHNPSALSYLDRIADDCDLLNGKSNFKISNTRTAGLAALKVGSCNEDYYVGGYDHNARYFFNSIGLCVQMLFDRIDISDRSLQQTNNNRYDKLKIFCEPTAEEKAYGLTPYVQLSQDQLAHYLDYVVIKENEYCQEFVIPEDLQNDMQYVKQLREQKRVFSKKGSAATKKNAEQTAKPVFDEAHRIVEEKDFKFSGFADLARQVKKAMGRLYPYKGIEGLRKKLSNCYDLQYLKDKK